MGTKAEKEAEGKSENYKDSAKTWNNITKLVSSDSLEIWQHLENSQSISVMVPPLEKQLIPTVESHWATTFKMLNYGKLLWGKRSNENKHRIFIPSISFAYRLYKSRRKHCWYRP